MDYLVAHTIGPVLDRKLDMLRAAPRDHSQRDLADRLFDSKVLDPAMGCGYFLLAALDFITDRLLAFLNEFPKKFVNARLAGLRRQPGNEGETDDRRLLEWCVLLCCLYGVDLDPIAVELAKAALWLPSARWLPNGQTLDEHLRCGYLCWLEDIRTRGRLSAGFASFDCVVGNPPYVRIQKSLTPRSSRACG